MRTTSTHEGMQSSAKHFIARLFVPALTILLVGCGEPGTGPLERGGDVAGLELRQFAERIGAATTKDTSWLDAFIVIDAPAFGVNDEPIASVRVSMTNEEGHDVAPVVQSTRATFSINPGYTFEWPVADGLFNATQDSTLPLTLNFKGPEEHVNLRYFFKPDVAGLDSLQRVFIDSTSNRFIAYTAAEVADSVACFLQVFSVDDVHGDGVTRYYTSSWTQPDTGSITIPDEAFGFVLIGHRAYLSVTRLHYAVEHTPSDRFIGVLRRTHRGLYIEKRQE